MLRQSHGLAQEARADMQQDEDGDNQRVDGDAAGLDHGMQKDVVVKLQRGPGSAAGSAAG